MAGGMQVGTSSWVVAPFGAIGLLAKIAVASKEALLPKCKLQHTTF